MHFVGHVVVAVLLPGRDLVSKLPVLAAVTTFLNASCSPQSASAKPWVSQRHKLSLSRKHSVAKHSKRKREAQAASGHGSDLDLAN